jgi:hypothetical protein
MSRTPEQNLARAEARRREREATQPERHEAQRQYLTEQETKRAAHKKDWAGADTSLSASEKAAIARAAATRSRILMGNGYGAWWVPLHEVLARTVTAGTLAARAEAEGWERFTYSTPVKVAVP